MVLLDKIIIKFSYAYEMWNQFAKKKSYLESESLFATLFGLTQNGLSYVFGKRSQRKVFLHCKFWLYGLES